MSVGGARSYGAGGVEVCEEFFKGQLGFDGEKYFVETPIARVNIKDPKVAFGHLDNNTHGEDRTGLSGAFVETLMTPLFVVRQKYKPQHTALARRTDSTITPAASAESKNTKTFDRKAKTDEIILDSFVFYKPFLDENGVIHLANFAISKDGELLHKTFYEPTLSRLKRILREKDENVLFMDERLRQNTQSGDGVMYKLSKVDLERTVPGSLFDDYPTAPALFFSHSQFGV